MAYPEGEALISLKACLEASFSQSMMQVDRFHWRFEATAKQYGFAYFLAAKAGTTLEAVTEELWGMSETAAYSDRPWGKLTKREISKCIDHLKAKVG